MKKQFKAESKRLLDLMIHSIYTHKEIFLRELISNASDAIDKLHFLSLKDTTIKLNKDSLRILIETDQANRILTISDNGLGMDKKALEDNLGTIAKSGSLLFKEERKEDENDPTDIIGQFGVGFYSAFMVAKKLVVVTKAYDSEVAYKWTSEGEDGYTIEETDKDTVGTTIQLYLKEDTEDEFYSSYLSEAKIRELIEKYSDYIRYPIKMEVERQIKKENVKEGEPEYTTDYIEETLNSMIPIWKRNKSEVTKEEYDDFYKSKFSDFENPLKTITMNIEGTISFDALLFIPTRAPYNYYTKEYEKGLQLYSRNVFIMDKASDLIPEHFRFVKGLVDSQDLSLNISREILQHDRQLKQIASRIEKKIKSELSNTLKNDREVYLTFFKQFGTQLKYGVYNEFGAHKALLEDLLMFYSSSEKQLVTLDEYVTRMKEGQEEIYFVSGESIEKIDRLPSTEKVKDKGFEILYLTDEVDEFCLQVMTNYNEKAFKSINQGDLDLDTQEEKEAHKEKENQSASLFETMKSALSDKVSDVKLSTRLKTHPVCLSATEGISLEMEKVLNQMPDANQVKARKVLEINGDHPIFETLSSLQEKDQDLLKEFSELLYEQAMLIEGFTIEDPIAYSNKVCDLMVRVNKVK